MPLDFHYLCPSLTLGSVDIIWGLWTRVFPPQDFKKSLILFMSVPQCFHFLNAYLLLRSEESNLVLVLSILKICIYFSELPRDGHNFIHSVNFGLSSPYSFSFLPLPHLKEWGPQGYAKFTKRLVIIVDVTEPLYPCFVCSEYLALPGIQIIPVLLATISNNI